MRIRIIIVLTAMIAAAAKAALSLVKKQDRGNGLVLNERSYSAGGIMRLVFTRKEKRMNIEMRPETAVLVKTDRKTERLFYILNGVTIISVLLGGVFSWLIGVTAVPYFICFLFILYYMLRKKDSVFVFSVILAVVVALSGVLYMEFSCILLLVCHIPVLIGRISLRKAG